MPHNFNLHPTAAFLSIKDGILSELPVLKSDIQSFAQIAETNMSKDIDTLNKLVYLRRLLEIENPQGLAWQLISNIFHKREVPQCREKDSTTRDLTKEEIAEATEVIRAKLPEFEYSTEYQKTQNVTAMLDLYRSNGSNYEKLQIYRIIFSENSDNAVVKKFVNETFHIENDYLFQLNPRKYNTVPQYIIEECDKDINQLQEALLSPCVPQKYTAVKR
jgi:superfamily II DNA helicase RecQ